MKTNPLTRCNLILSLLSILLLELSSCSLPDQTSGSSQNQATATASGEGTIQFYLTADSIPVHVTHANGSITNLNQGESVPVVVGEKITVDAGGLGKLLYSDRINIEILQKTELILAKITEVTGGRIEATVNLSGGHVHIRTSDNGKADIILKTDDSTISTLVDDTDFTVCYAPGPDGLTCHPVIHGSIKVFGKEGSMVYDGPSAGYTFNGQAPQPAICFHEDEYKAWLGDMRKGDNDVGALGELVSKWYNQPCPGATQALMTMETPTAMAMATSDYFMEEFNADFDVQKWPAFMWNNGSGSDFSPEDMTVTVKDGYLVFNIDKPNISNYVVYDPSDYGNVKISISAHNGGQNNNNVSLICRYSHEGWYEFQIGNDGLYSILAFMAVERRYYTLYSGGSKAILSGMGVNEYSASCINNELTLFINGNKVTSIKDFKHQLGAGKVGFGVSSNETIPVLVEIDWFKVEETQQQ